MGDTAREVSVLHVEDDEAFAEVTELKLDEQGRFDVTIETDPGAALDRIVDDGFDCIVSDYDMPDMDGLALLETVRARDCDIPFILFTGKGSETIASRAISAGVTDYLQKGAGSDTYALLANRIENAVERHRTEQRLRAQQRLSERIVRASPIAIVVHDLEGDVILTNERATEILGAGADELDANAYAESSWELYDADGEYVPAEELPHSRVVRGEEIRKERYTVVTGDDTEREVLAHGAPLRDEDGNIDGAVVPFEAIGDE